MNKKQLICFVSILFLLAGLVSYAQDISVSDTDKVVMLDEALIISVQNSPLLMSGLMDTVLVKYKLNEARKAYNPTIMGTAAYNKTGPKKTSEVDGKTVQTVADEQGYLNAGITWNLDVNGQIKRAVLMQSESYNASKYSFATSLSDLINNVKAAFFSCLMKKDNLKTAQSALAISEENLKNVSLEVEVGNKPKFDMTRQEYDVTVRKNAVVTAENNFATALNNFNLLLGLDKRVYIPADTSPDSVNISGVDMNNEKMIDIALTNRTELKQLEKAMSASKTNIDYAKGLNYPSVQLTGAYKQNLVQRDLNGDDSWNAMLGVSIPIWQGGVVDEKVNQAKTSYEQMGYNYNSQKQNIITSVLNSELNLKSSGELITVAMKSIELAKENLKIANLRYEQEVGTYLDVSTALDQLVQAENDYTNARYSYAINVYNLERQIGKQPELPKFMELIWEAKKLDE